MIRALATGNCGTVATRAAQLSFLLLVFLVGCHGRAVPQDKPLVYRDVHELFSGDCRALAIAAASGDLETIKQLASSGVDVDCTGYARATPLYWAIAARRTNRSGLEALLESGANPNHLLLHGTPLVHIASMRADEASWVLETVLRHGGDPNAVEARGGTTPLFSAGTHAAVVALVEASAD